MKILQINNMAEFLPEYPNHKIVLFEDSPEIIAQPHTLHTSAKLWYNFAEDPMIGADYMDEKGGVTEDRAENIANWLMSALGNKSYWTTIDHIHCVES
jgi:hypothetical protein